MFFSAYAVCVLRMVCVSCFAFSISFLMNLLCVFSTYGLSVLRMVCASLLCIFHCLFFTESTACDLHVYVFCVWFACHLCASSIPFSVNVLCVFLHLRCVSLCDLRMVGVSRLCMFHYLFLMKLLCVFVLHLFCACSVCVLRMVCVLYVVLVFCTLHIL